MNRKSEEEKIVEQRAKDMLNLRASYDYACLHKGYFCNVSIADFADHLDAKYNFDSINSIEIEKSQKIMIKHKWAVVDPQTGELKLPNSGIESLLLIQRFWDGRCSILFELLQIMQAHRS